MKKIQSLIGILCILSVATFAQNINADKKAAGNAEKKSAASLRFEKAVTAINTKDFVVFIEFSYNEIQLGSDFTQFLSLEKGFFYYQTTDCKYTQKLKVTDYKEITDKDGNIRIVSEVKGYFIRKGRIEIILTKGDNLAEVSFWIPNKGTGYFYGALLPTNESGYLKRPMEI
jgi:hypothetical protein